MEELLQKLFEHSNSIVLITDESFRIRFVSSGVEQVFGVLPMSLLGKNAFDFVQQEKRTEWRDCLWKANNNISAEIVLNTKSGREFNLDVTVSNLIQYEQIRGIVIVLRDQTRQSKVQSELTKTNQHLGEFIFKTTHDLKAPINSALGLVSLAEVSKVDERERYLQLARVTLQKMNTLLDELTKFHEVERLALLNKPIDTSTFFAQEIELLRNQPEATKIKFDLDILEDAPFHSDPIRLQAIFTNILSNSIKYSDPEKKEQFVSINISVSANECIISIEDNGIGISKKDLPKIFDKFFRVSSKIEGTGIGLHIVKDTIRRLGGAIDVASEPGSGTTFTVIVPNLAPPAD